jgi:hypothetical protein
MMMPPAMNAHSHTASAHQPLSSAESGRWLKKVIL